jgi:Tfp pilus assembly protein PilO
VTARLKNLSPTAQVALVVGVLLLVVVVGYFALVAPKRSDAASLKQQTAAVQAEIARNSSSAFTQALPAVRSANVFSLTQAMPTKLDTPGVIITLNSMAKASGISFDSIQQSAGSGASPVATATPDPFAAQPIQVQFTGSYYNLLTFLQRMRNLVRVENGRLYTAGRLFDVTNVALAEGPKKWPQVQATLTINEFVPQAAAVPTPTTGTGTTSTTTTGTTTTTSSSTSAAPSTSGGTS